jgi:hypothetical protein
MQTTEADFGQPLLFMFDDALVFGGVECYRLVCATD